MLRAAGGIIHVLVLTALIVRIVNDGHMPAVFWLDSFKRTVVVYNAQRSVAGFDGDGVAACVLGLYYAVIFVLVSAAVARNGNVQHIGC